MDTALQLVKGEDVIFGHGVMMSLVMVGAVPEGLAVEFISRRSVPTAGYTRRNCPAGRGAGRSSWWSGAAGSSWPAGSDPRSSAQSCPKSKSAVDYDVHKDGQSKHKRLSKMSCAFFENAVAVKVVHPPGDGQELPEPLLSWIWRRPGGQGGQLGGVRLGSASARVVWQPIAGAS